MVVRATKQESDVVREKRRALLDAIYAIHAGEGQIRIDLALAQTLERAWDEYDDAIRDEFRATLPDAW